MAFLSSFSVVGSGLTAQQLRLDVVSENITNMNVTRTENGEPYRRKMTIFESQDDRNNASFRSVLARQAAVPAIVRNREGLDIPLQTGGVRVTEIVEDPSDLKLVYDPTHPDANVEGYLEMPNVDLVKEMTDAMAATRAYAANVTALNTLKSVLAKGLEIGR